MSVVFATVAIPAVTARMKDPRRGLVIALTSMAMFNLFYWFGLFVIWPRLAGGGP
jgi:hypothetical protein